jgi:hypothetical protein
MLHGQFACGHPGVKGGRVEHATAPFCRCCGECRAEIGRGFRQRKKCIAGNSAQTARSTLCCVGGTEVGACLLNVIVSRHGIQSRACGDKSVLVTKLAMQIAWVSSWSAETKSPQWSGGRVCTKGNVQPVGRDEEKPTKPRCPGKYRSGWPW